MTHTHNDTACCNTTTNCCTDSLEDRLVELVTLRDWLRYSVSRFNQAEIFCGHGCREVYDEAVWLLLKTLHLPLHQLEPFLDASILSEERARLNQMIEARANDRIPTAYLTQEAWLGDYRFYVDPRVIIPRSFFAELLEDGFSPWVQDVEHIHTALDLCTGSGCLAILMSEVFPNATIVASDISDDALAVAARNRALYQLEERITLHKSDLFDQLGNQTFDLIISNPPYVTTEAMEALPPEYCHEPALALASGEDGMDAVRRILAQAAAHLTATGVLAVEVGHLRDAIEASFPTLPFQWLSTAESDGMVFVLNAADCQRYADSLK